MVELVIADGSFGQAGLSNYTSSKGMAYSLWNAALYRKYLGTLDAGKSGADAYQYPLIRIAYVSCASENI